MNPLHQLYEFGQSVWMDNLSREMFGSGQLKQFKSDYGLTGITCNPTTFAKALSSGDAYDDDIRAHAEQDHSPEQAVEEMLAKDVRMACDVFADIYEKTNGEDGFVSIEVAPNLARHTQETIEAARRMWRLVDRPNCMVKIPGTREGLPAIEQALVDGINVNITLLFSPERYEEVVDAHVGALKQRSAAGLPIKHIASVASFFLSRIDVMVDELLAHRAPPGAPKGGSMAGQLMGKTAIACAKQTYQAFERLYGENPAWQTLAQHEPRLQRPLWASTGVKSPDLPETYYVDALVAPQTVNTMPEKTLKAYAEEGNPSESAIKVDMGVAEQQIEALSKLEIHYRDIAHRLEDQGIQKFVDSWDQALATAKERLDEAKKQHA
ncbi:MAG: transaldolase [Opitutales bacterium]